MLKVLEFKNEKKGPTSKTSFGGEDLCMGDNNMNLTVGDFCLRA